MASALPIHSISARFRECIRERPVVVTAPTGSGKSTMLPIWLSEELDGPILVVEPRRIACRSLAGYVAQLCGTSLGEGVGYRIRFSDRSSSSTRILFVTPGVALRMLRSATASSFSAVVIDEFHERGWEVDLILAILRRHLLAGASFRLVVASATIDAESTAALLGGDVLRAEGRTFPVEISHAGGVPVPTADDLSRRVTEALATSMLSDTQSHGDALVFLPVMREIDACRAELRHLASREGLELVRVHGTLPTEAVADALSGKSSRRRVFLATNVAETSLTIPNVTLVVDSGLARQRLHRGGRSSLVLGPVSQASMDQRAGRAGRVAPGRCVRLWDRAYEPQAQAAPEIMRIELDDVLLHASASGLDITSPDSAPWPSIPPDFAFFSAKEHLVRLGGIAEDGVVTERGHALLGLPVSVLEARLLAGVPDELAGDVADLVALMQTRSGLLLPIGNLPDAVRDDVLRERNTLLDKCGDDVTAEITMLRCGQIRSHHLHPTALSDARKVSRLLRALVGSSEADPVRDSRPFKRSEELVGYLLSRWQEAGFVVRERALKKRRGKAGSDGERRRRGEPWANGSIEVLVDPSPFWGKDRNDGHCPEAGLILRVEWVAARGTGVMGFGKSVLPCTYRDLSRAGLGDTAVAAPSVRIRKSGIPVVNATVERTLGGVIIDTSEGTLTGDRLRNVLAELILSNRVMKGASVQILDDLHLCAILADWPALGLTVANGAGEFPFADPEAYVISRLTALGVEESEDLALVDKQDLCPDIGILFGLFENQIQKFRDELPRIWDAHGAQYTCHVSPRSSKVVIEPLNASAKRANPPDTWMLPSFHGFRVDFRKASRVIQLR